MLPVIRKAYDEKRLQAFDKLHTLCSYDGPCAIGVCFDKKLLARIEIDDKHNNSINHLERLGYVSMPINQYFEIIELQRTHDRWNTHKREEHENKFESLLTTLEQKYL